MEYIIKEKYQGWRLDKFLTEKGSQTRSQIKKTILNGSVLVNKETAKVHTFLKAGDKVQTEQPITKTEKPDAIPKKQEKSSLLKKIKNIFVKRQWAGPTPKIIHKTKNYLIIEKPTNLLVHATENSTEPTLVDWLVKNFPEMKKITDPVSLKKGDFTFRPGIVHRLDRDVSGLMLITLNQDTFEYFKSQFKLKKIGKKYTALVHGEMPIGPDQIDFEISRSNVERKMAAHPAGSGKGLPSLTEFNVIKNSQKSSLVEINLYTGRTNQIRVHFNALGHPVVGDNLYTQKVFAKDNAKATRLMLHATELSFTDQEGNQQTFQSVPPASFNL